jgi:hypothetical protein
VSHPNDIRALSVGAATVARVDATRSWRRCTFDASGEGWFRLADKLADPAGLDAWYQAEVDGTGHGHRDLAGALIVYRFAGSLAELIIGPLLEQRRAVLLRPESLSLLLGERARIEALSVGSPEVAVLPSDPDVGRAGPGTGVVVVADEAALRTTAVEGMLAVFGPLAAAVRERAPFGLRGMWGTLADHLSDVSLRRARDRKSDSEAAWQLASALIDELAERQPLLRARPSRHLVTHEHRSALFSTKGTCCLIYKTNMPVVEGRSDRDTTPFIAADACTSCPLRSPDDRESRLVRHLTG